MNSYKFFEDIVTRLEQMQEALDSLREAVKQKVRECAQKEPAQ